MMFSKLGPADLGSVSPAQLHAAELHGTPCWGNYIFSKHQPLNRISVFCKMNAAIHSGHYCSNTTGSALNELLRTYSMPFRFPNGAGDVEVSGETINN